MKTDKSGRTSAGILLWRSRVGRLEVLLAHQGGPFWVKKDVGHWTIPKGEAEPGEEFVAVARRKFAEETGCEAPDHPLIELGQITQKSGKRFVRALREGWIAGAALDVLRQEPPPADRPLLTLDNALVTPHAAFYSDPAIVELQTKAATNVANVLSGRLPATVVNPGVRELAA